MLKSSGLTSSSWLGVGLILILVGIIYLKTILPGLGYSGDTAKFQYIGKILGIPHAPGYPLYVLLNRIFVCLPVRNVAFRANFMSLFFGLLTLIFLYLILLESEIPFFLALGSTLSLAFNLTFWSQSLVAEVYTLNSFFLALIVFFLTRWLKKGNDRFFFLALFFSGLSLAHHLTIILTFPALVCLLLLFRPHLLLLAKTWRAGLLSLFAGLLPYLFLFIRTRWRAPYVEAPVRNMGEFLRTLTAQRFQEKLFVFNLRELFLERLPWFGQHLTTKLSWPLLLICLFGLIYWLRSRRPLALFLLIFFFSQALFILNYDIPDIAVFFIPVYFVLTIFLAAGWSWLKLKVDRFVERGRKLRLKPWLATSIPFFCLIASFSFLFSHFSQAKMSSVDVYDGRLNALFDSFQPGRVAIVLPANYHESQFFNYKIYVDYPQLLVLRFDLDPREKFLSQLKRKLNREIRGNKTLKALLFENCGQATSPEILVCRFWSEAFRSQREEILASVYFVSPSLRQWLADQGIRIRKIISAEKKRRRFFAYYQALVPPNF
jgi:hypothetical protein